MPFCGECGKPVPGSQKFCGECGSGMSNQKDTPLPIQKSHLQTYGACSDGVENQDQLLQQQQPGTGYAQVLYPPTQAASCCCKCCEDDGNAAIVLFIVGVFLFLPLVYVRAVISGTVPCPIGIVPRAVCAVQVRRVN